MYLCDFDDFDGNLLGFFYMMFEVVENGLDYVVDCVVLV